MTPGPLGIPEFVYSVLIVALICLVVIGVIFVLKSFYTLRDLFREIACDENRSWLLRILVIPLWFLFAIPCLIMSAIGWLLFLCAVLAGAEWLFKDKK